ncbi:MAG TPA: polysaccharide deacetylase family protein [Solirubrobacteraceae bacterium]|nr:polysaccharide deacetylase family protein [Solirubrobacteraceae bacterium]
MPSASSLISARDHRRAVLPTAGALLGALLLARSLPALAGAWPALRAPLGIEDRTSGGSGYALTFDDGPHAQGTPAVLDVLASAGVAATFFLVGEQVRRDPALAREIAARGHTVALHCDRHRNLLRLTGAQVREDLARALDTICAATGREPGLYRPPYGIATTPALRAARRYGWRTVLWSDWGRDWEDRADADSITELATRDACDGAVVLLHDADDYGAPGSWRATVRALPRIIEALDARGLAPAPL